MSVLRNLTRPPPMFPHGSVKNHCKKVTFKGSNTKTFLKHTPPSPSAPSINAPPITPNPSPPITPNPPAAGALRAPGQDQNLRLRRLRLPGPGAQPLAEARAEARALQAAPWGGGGGGFLRQRRGGQGKTRPWKKRDTQGRTLNIVFVVCFWSAC